MTVIASSSSFPDQMVVTFDQQELRKHQQETEGGAPTSSIDISKGLSRARSDTNVTLATEDTGDELMSGAFSDVPSSDSSESSTDDCLLFAQETEADLKEETPSSPPTAGEEAIETPSTKTLCENPVAVPRTRRSSILKQYDASSIPIKEKRASWKQLPKPDLKLIRANTCPAVMESDASHCVVKSALKTGGVRFQSVQIRAYDQTIGDNPSVSYGPPISLDWDYEELDSMDLEVYEATRGPRRTMRQMMMNYYSRRNVLSWRFGATEEELKQAERDVNKIKRSRSFTKALLPAQIFEEVVQSAARKTKRLTAGKRRSS